MSGPGGGSGFKGSSTETPSQTVGDGGFYIKDQGSADANKAGYGQLWIKTGVDAAPNDLYFVNEDGQQVRITNGSSIAAAAEPQSMHTILILVTTMFQFQPRLETLL